MRGKPQGAVGGGAFYPPKDYAKWEALVEAYEETLAEARASGTEHRVSLDLNPRPALDAQLFRRFVQLANSPIQLMFTSVGESIDQIL